jgi:GNAT superfamily N-acetyltransferase
MTASSVRVRPLQCADERDIEGVSRVLVDCVEGGASVSFMLPLPYEKARGFWSQAAQSMARGERCVLVAESDAGAIVGTVMLVLPEPENQPHRGDVAKMLVHRAARGRGVGAALLLAIEHEALRRGRTLLVLDTASATAERLYRRHGWQAVGRIPDYALLPAGGFCDTTVMFKRLR